MRTQNTQAKPLAERFANLAQNEVMRITPFTLHITHYSRAHAAWPGRPKIHFEGEMHMQHAGTTVADPTGDSGHRLLKGVVHMAASGDVRWSLVRQFPLPSCQRVLCERLIILDACISLATATTGSVAITSRAYSSAGPARPWVSLVYGQARMWSNLAQ